MLNSYAWSLGLCALAPIMRAMPLTDLKVDGFKGIDSVHFASLSRINYFIGKNGSGKSAVFEALALPTYFIVNNSNGELQVAYHGNITEVIHHNFVTEVVYLDEGGNNKKYTCTLKVKDHQTIQTDENSFNRLIIASSGATGQQVGQGGQEWRSAILDMAASLEEQAHAKFVYPFDLDNVPEPEVIKDFLNKHYVRQGEYVRNVVRSATGSSAVLLEITTIEDKGTTIRTEPLKALSYGYKQLLSLYFSIQQKLLELIAVKPQQSILVCIEEPGLGLHPGLQKKLPLLLDELLQDERLQSITLFVTTHSPFIISAASEVKDQKTYLMDDGSLVNLAGDKVSNSTGFTGAKCLQVAASMIGAGFNDLAEAPITKESTNIYYCEGESRTTKDSLIYTEIFRDESSKHFFISTGGLLQAVNAYYKARTAVKFVFGNDSKAFALVDRSCSKRDVPVGLDEYIEKTSATKPIFTDDERTKFLASDKLSGYRMLKRKEIENYLYDPAVVALLPEAERSVFSATKLSAANKTATNLDYQTGEVKDFLSGRPKHLQMAELIRTNRTGATAAMYNELLDCLTSPE